MLNTRSTIEGIAGGQQCNCVFSSSNVSPNSSAVEKIKSAFPSQCSNISNTKKARKESGGVRVRDFTLGLSRAVLLVCILFDLYF